MWMCLVKFIISERLLIAFSSIAPKELYMKTEHKRMMRAKIQQSWLESWSVAPNPSESKIIVLMILPSLSFVLRGLPHIHIPFVHAFTVGATPNPESQFKIILLRRYDLPVLYIPATPTTHIGD